MITFNQLERVYDTYQNKRILIACITNLVTINDVANGLSAINASPLMSHDLDDMKEIMLMANGLYLNIGTLDPAPLMLMEQLLADKQLKLPIALDPVGAGATTVRTNWALKLLTTNKITLIRGNQSELKALLGMKTNNQGIDSNESTDNGAEIVLKVAQKFNCLAVMSGLYDYASDGKLIYQVSNGHQDMTKIIGTGCVLTAILTVFISLKLENLLVGVVFALAMYGIAGQRACQIINNNLGYFKNELLNQLSNFNWETFKRYAKIKQV